MCKYVCTLVWSGERDDAWLIAAPSGVHKSHGIEADLSNQSVVWHHHGHTAKQHLHQHPQEAHRQYNTTPEYTDPLHVQHCTCVRTFTCKRNVMSVRKRTCNRAVYRVRIDTQLCAKDLQVTLTHAHARLNACTHTHTDTHTRGRPTPSSCREAPAFLHSQGSL